MQIDRRLHPLEQRGRRADVLLAIGKQCLAFLERPRPARSASSRIEVFSTASATGRPK